LHATAQQITDNYEGRVPSGEGELRALPGVGEYTAAAIRAFAFGLESIVLDVNVRRVISRAWSGVDAPASHLSTVERALAQSLATAADDSSVWAAASMELGAIVCTKKTPQCSSCPLKRTCAWRTAGFP
jgi:A/G-specific adenine glycosylase